MERRINKFIYSCSLSLLTLQIELCGCRQTNVFCWKTRHQTRQHLGIIKFISFILYFKWNYFNNKLFFLVLTTNFSIIFVTHSSSFFTFSVILFIHFNCCCFWLIFISFLYCWIIHCNFYKSLLIHFTFFLYFSFQYGI